MKWQPDGKRKKELWENNISKFQKFKIETRIIWRRYMVQTHGMGFIILLLIGGMLISMFTPLIISQLNQYNDNTRYKDALTGACPDKTFYAWNFKSCENIAVRPQ